MRYTSFNVIVFLVLISAIYQCKNSDKQNMMMGKIKENDFLKPPYKTWYEEEYSTYDIDSTILDSIDLRGINIKFLFGSWCSDSRREVPRFIKILKYKNYNFDSLEMIGLDREKQAPIYQENTLNIEFVPTFVIFKNNSEIGRIIESPDNSLEKDLSIILKNSGN